MKKRTTALILSLLMVLPSLAACSENAANPEESTAADTSAVVTPSEEETVPEEESAEEILPDIPALDFGDETFTFLTVGPGDTNGGDWETYDLWVEGLNGDVINDSVYERNLYIEDTYKVKIAEFKPAGGTFDEIRNEVQSASGAFDAAFTHIENGANLSQNGYLLDLYTINYINLEQPWWDQRGVEDLKIMNSLYFATGDITITDNDATWVLMFNKQMLENYQMPNLYDLVREDNWHFDDLHDLAAQASVDMNGDGAMKWKDDQFGFITSDASTYGLLYASGEKLVFPDNETVLRAISDVERLSGVIEKAGLIMSDKNITFEMSYEGSSSDDIRIMFQEGKGLFYGEVTQCIIRMRASETDFGLIPWPKYDENQTDFYNWIHTSAGTGIVVPSSQTNYEMTGAIIEAMAAKSMYTLTPAYYDVALTYKYMRDAESSEMLDIILHSRIYDLGRIYNFGGLSSAIATTINTGGDNFGSLWGRGEKVFTKNMEATIEKYQELKGNN